MQFFQLKDTKGKYEIQGERTISVFWKLKPFQVKGPWLKVRGIAVLLSPGYPSTTMNRHFSSAEYSNGIATTRRNNVQETPPHPVFKSLEAETMYLAMLFL